MNIEGQNIHTIFVTCPHCAANIEIQPYQLNCAIFRHGAFVDTLEPLDPHASKEVCEWLVSNKMIYGCGKPFRIIQDTSGYIKTVVCDYI